MRSLKSKIVISCLYLAALLVLLYVIQVVLNEYRYRDIENGLKYITPQHLLTASLLVILNYFILTFYDTFSIQYIGRTLPYFKIAFAAFVSYTFSHNIGFGAVSGGAIRLRFYSKWGFSPLEVTKIILFSGINFWLGLLLLGSLTSLIYPAAFAKALHFSKNYSYAYSALLALPVVVYLCLAIFKGGKINFLGRSFEFPSTTLALKSLTLAAVDWIIAAAVFYALLPDYNAASFFTVLTAFIVAQLLGVVSHVPGGLGVFETVILLSLGNVVSRPGLVAALLIFRCIYYLLPFMLGVVCFSLYELKKQLPIFQAVKDRLKSFEPILSSIVPQVLSISTFIAGIVLLFSGTTPAIPLRMDYVSIVIPLRLIEASHFVNSITAILLLFVSWSIKKRLIVGRLIAILLTAVGVIVSILKGLDFEEAFYCSLLFIGLLCSKRYFYRNSTIFSTLNFQTIIATIAVLICAVWLGMFSYKHVNYAHELWWRFELSGDAPRFLRAAIGASIVVMIVLLRLLLRPPRQSFIAPTKEELQEAYKISLTSDSTESFLSLLGDKEILLNHKKNAYIMYRFTGRCGVVLGDPVGDKNEFQELIWNFRDLCDEQDCVCAFYEVSEKYLPLYIDAGLSLVKVGEEALVPLSSFSIEGSQGKHFRHVINKLNKDGYSFTIIPPEQFSEVLPQIRQISEEWLNDKSTGEKGFSLGFFSEDYLKHFATAVVKKNSQIFCFANVLATADKTQLSIDLMRYQNQAPNGMMDFLMINLMLWGRQQGYLEFNLGMAPLAGLPQHKLSSIWSRIGGYISRHGEHFYKFEGLRRYKEKFSPNWGPKYLAHSGGMMFPFVLGDIATLISGGLGGLVSKGDSK